jgi:Uma2 family endonuclease
MGNAALNLPMSEAEFLAWDATQTIKHEFVRGEVFAMTGATKAHIRLTLNVAMALLQHLRGSPCRTYATDIKLRVETADTYFYPDVLVTCSAADAADPAIVREPVLVVEVLSPSTAAYDATAKFAAYRQLPSLREYVLIDPQSRRCDVYRLGDAGLWVLHPFEAGQDLRLASVELDLPAAVLWDEVPVVVAAPSTRAG